MNAVRYGPSGFAMHGQVIIEVHCFLPGLVFLNFFLLFFLKNKILYLITPGVHLHDLKKKFKSFVAANLTSGCSGCA